MASLTYSNALLPLAGTDGKEAVEQTRPGFFTRLVEAIVESRRRQAEREIARLELIYGFKLRPDATTGEATRDLPFNA
jgi:hypothetical protein